MKGGRITCSSGSHNLQVLEGGQRHPELGSNRGIIIRGARDPYQNSSTSTGRYGMISIFAQFSISSLDNLLCSTDERSKSREKFWWRGCVKELAILLSLGKSSPPGASRRSWAQETLTALVLIKKWRDNPREKALLDVVG